MKKGVAVASPRAATRSVVNLLERFIFRVGRSWAGFYIVTMTAGISQRSYGGPDGEGALLDPVEGDMALVVGRRSVQD